MAGALKSSRVQQNERPQNRTPFSLVRGLGPLLLVLLLSAGCAKYNTYYNAKRSFDVAENVREEALKKNLDPPTPTGTQKNEYEQAIKKAQKVLDEYPGHSLTDDALFLQAKAHHRLESYRQSIRQLDLLFQNYPATEYMEESLYLQGLNFLLIGAVDRSQDYLDRLASAYPESRYQAETRKVSGDNAFILKEWEAAAASYQEYLELEKEQSERDRVGLKLAECYWELEQYRPAAEVLQRVSQNTESADLDFRARLLRARVHVRMGDYDIAGNLIDQLNGEAEIYAAQGDVLLVEAESLVAQDRSSDAAPLLENMPTDWETPAVKARAAELLGGIFLERGNWEKAQKSFQTAIMNRPVLEDEDRVRQLGDNLKDYLAADQALPDASGDRVARLKLLQANSLLFGFERPRMAATLYAEAADDTAAAEKVAARALYGAVVTYDRYLDLPDSADYYRSALLERYPDSPQAFEAGAESNPDLLGYLLALREAEQADAYAELTPEEREALTVLPDLSASVGQSRGGELAGVRRRMVYLARRDNIVFPPPQRAVEMINQEQQERLERQALDAARAATFDSLQALEGATAAPEDAPPVVDEFGNTSPINPTDPTAADGTAAGAKGDENGTQTADSKEDANSNEKGNEKSDDKKKDAKKKKQDDDWDFLR